MKVCPRCSELYPDDADQCPKDATPLRTVLDPLIGKTVGGRFRLIQRLGSGGMSSVYLARHVLIDRLMAIKTLRRDLARDPVQRDRFLREARAVNRINHENIVEISDFGETEDGLVYLVMEYVPGEPLLRVLADGPLLPLRALDIAEQCGNALSRAHQMGVIHRDLKPENILIVQRRDRRDYVKLLDFGIAKILDAPSLTGSQQIFGTPGYIAPEYIQSTDIDGRADIYSLGCILYEMCTGALPFDYEYPGDLLVKHVTEPPVKPSVRHAEVHPAMEAFILRCLAKNPDERFRDAFHFNAELRAVRERLGPDSSWGGLDERSDVHARVAVDVDTSVDGDHRQLFDGIAQALGEPKPGTTPYGVEVPSARDTIAEGIPRADVAVSQEGPAIPESPALDGPIAPAAIDAVRADPETPTPLVRNRFGLVGTTRWRQRYDALRRHLDELDAPPPEIAHAMAFAERTLEELEEAVGGAQAYQEAVEALNERARDFRGTLGRALDQVAGRLSAERGVFEALVTRRNSLRARREAARVKLRRGEGTEGEADALLWELAAVDEELSGAGQRCDDLEAQRAELAAELDGHNEQFETERAQLVRVLDAQMLRLESTAAALRRPLEQAEQHIRAAWPGTPAEGRESGPSSGSVS
ncbi:MAG: protein kinase [Myxococcota bacterium]|nr:protein kinase [Myxococcota bacterium]